MTQVFPLSGHIGGECFLLLDADFAVLVDSGFAFCADRLVAQIEGVLQGRPLDAILLTHSHYDHISGCDAIIARFPETVVYAHPLTAALLEKPSVRDKIRELNETAAMTAGFPSWSATETGLRIARPLSDADTLSFGGETVTAKETPGHTRCSLCFWFSRAGLLVTCETLGLLTPAGVAPAFVTSASDAALAVRHCSTLPVTRILSPHWGEVSQQMVPTYFSSCASAIDTAVQFILRRHRQGMDAADIVQAYTDAYYPRYFQHIQPFNAFLLNTRVMVQRLCQSP